MRMNLLHSLVAMLKLWLDHIIWRSVGLLAADTSFEIGEAAGGIISLDISGLLGGSATQDGLIDVSSENGDGGKVLVKASDTVSATGASSTLANAGDLGSGGEVIFFSENTATWEPDSVISAQGGQGKRGWWIC